MLTRTPSTTSEQTTTTERITIPIITTEAEPEVINNPPVIKNRLAKLVATAGKQFNHTIPLDTFYDIEDGNNLKLTLLDKYDQPLDAKSWIQFNPDTREIYAL